MRLANAALIALFVLSVALLALAFSSWPAWSGILLTTGSIGAGFHVAWLGSVALVIRSVVIGMIAGVLIGGIVWALGFEVVGVWIGVAVAVGVALIALAVFLNRGDTPAEHRAGSKGARIEGSSKAPGARARRRYGHPPHSCRIVRGVPYATPAPNPAPRRVG